MRLRSHMSSRATPGTTGFADAAARLAEAKKLALLQPSTDDEQDLRDLLDGKVQGIIRGRWVGVPPLIGCDVWSGLCLLCRACCRVCLASAVGQALVERQGRETGARRLAVLPAWTICPHLSPTPGGEASVPLPTTGGLPQSA
jgi:hypothetical protein